VKHHEMTILTRQPTTTIDEQLTAGLAEDPNLKRSDARKSIGRKESNYVYRSRSTRLMACPYFFS
jgi:hypothetical protein